MFGGFAKAIFGSSNDRYVRSLRKIVDQVNGLEAGISAISPRWRTMPPINWTS